MRTAGLGLAVLAPQCPAGWQSRRGYPGGRIVAARSQGSDAPRNAVGRPAHESRRAGIVGWQERAVWRRVKARRRCSDERYNGCAGRQRKPQPSEAPQGGIGHRHRLRSSLASEAAAPYWTVACHRERQEDTGCQSHCGTDAQERGSLHRLPFQDRSRVIRPHERRRESLHAHYGSQRAQSLWRTRGRGRQDHHEPHGHANSGGRIESHRRREVQPSNLGPALGRNEASYADDDGEESDE